MHGGKHTLSGKVLYLALFDAFGHIVGIPVAPQFQSCLAPQQG